MNSATSIVVVKTHHNLQKVTEEDIRDHGAEILKCADQGIQTAVVARDGKTVKTVIGLNGCRYLPDPDPDPLDEILLMALHAVRGKAK